MCAGNRQKPQGRSVVFRNIDHSARPAPYDGRRAGTKHTSDKSHSNGDVNTEDMSGRPEESAGHQPNDRPSRKHLIGTIPHPSTKQGNEAVPTTGMHGGAAQINAL